MKPGGCPAELGYENFSSSEMKASKSPAIAQREMCLLMRLGDRREVGSPSIPDSVGSTPPAPSTVTPPALACLPASEGNRTKPTVLSSAAGQPTPEHLAANTEGQGGDCSTRWALGVDNHAMVKMLVESQQSVTLLLVAKTTPPSKTLKGSKVVSEQVVASQSEKALGALG